jgi:hypothetical protein
MPPSVRFWGRRVYWAPIVLLVTALRQGRNPDVTLNRLKGICGVWRTTVKRWQRYFRQLFPQSIACSRLSGRLMPPIATDELLGALLERFYPLFSSPETALAACLKTLALGP